MQITILKRNADGKCYPNYDEMIRNAKDDDEKAYLQKVKERNHGGFAFEIIYTQRQACGHYEIFQHPIYRNYGKEPTEEQILESLENVIKILKAHKKENRKCTRCICGWNAKEEN